MSGTNCGPRCETERFFQPNVRIWESTEAIELVAEVPGADESSTDLTVEHDTLTLTARVPRVDLGTGKLVYSELRDGGYRRTFRLSDQIDRQKIEARVKDGVLRVRLPKSDQAVSKKISVLAG
jgi:HSP20 family protein